MMEVHAYLALALGAVEDWEAAVREGELSIGSLRYLVRRGREAYRPLFAHLVNSSAAWHHERNDVDAAVKAATEAVEQYRILADREPDTYRPLLAGSYHSLVTRQRAARPVTADPANAPSTVPAQFVRALMLGQQEARVRLLAEVKQIGSAQARLFVQAAFSAAVRRYFVIGLDRHLIAGFLASVRKAFATDVPVAGMEVLIRRELGDDVSAADIDVTTELRAYGAILVVVGDLLGHDEAEINAILTRAETAVDKRGPHATPAATGDAQHS